MHFSHSLTSVKRVAGQEETSFYKPPFTVQTALKVFNFNLSFLDLPVKASEMLRKACKRCTLGKEDGRVFRKFCKFNLKINLNLRRYKPTGIACKQHL